VTNTVGAETFVVLRVATTASRQTGYERPPTVIVVDSGDTRVRRMSHHWKKVPSSPRGARPIWRIWSASHIEARISSRVPASRPRMASPARVKRSRWRSCWRMALIAAGGVALGLCAASGIARMSEKASTARRFMISVVRIRQ
jgi:hypothetical protein